MMAPYRAMMIAFENVIMAILSIIAELPLLAR